MAQQKFDLQGKNVAENKLNSSEYGFKILNPVNVKTNFNFAIHQSKTFVVVLVNTFDVSSFMLVKNNDVGANYMSAAYFLIGDSRRLG